MYLMTSTQSWHKMVWSSNAICVCGYMLRNSLWNPIENSSYLPFYKSRWVWNSQSVWRAVVLRIFFMYYHDENGKKVDMMENLHAFYDKYELSFVYTLYNCGDVTVTSHDHNGVSNHWLSDCWFNELCKLTTKWYQSHPLVRGNASNKESVSIILRHLHMPCKWLLC